MKGLRSLACLLAALSVLSSCDFFENKSRTKKGDKLDKVLILYHAGFNSLSGDLLGDLDELKQGDLPGIQDDKAIVIVSHNTTSYLNYGVRTKPCVIRLYKDKSGQPVMDTLARYSEDDLLTRQEVMSRSLNYVAETFKADHYGLILSSHGTGWLPAGYYNDPDKYKTAAGGAKSAPHYVFPTGPVPYVEREPMPGPRTRTYGEEIVNKDGTRISYEMDIKDLPAAIPFHLDYILMDVCLMGCVEVAYELRDRCDLLGFSPAEILADGLDYTKIASRLLRNGDPDLRGVLDDYYDLYAALSGDYQSACYTLIDCSKLDALARACQAAFAASREQIAALRPASVQPLFRSYHHWFYDLEDILDKAGCSGLSAVRSALDQCVVHEIHTDSFMPRSGGFHFDAFCGLSMYLPCNGSAYLDAYYKTLAWNKATSLVQ
ncbi:MAG: hypothetical protein IJ654_10300 [Bacteroidales bacterium]|nr:hypothetical protein [Bacteroidales bacterium]